MIKLDDPSMVWNAEGVPGPDYHLWNTWRVAASEHPAHVFGWTAVVAAKAPGGKLRALVSNSHGRPAWLGVGTGIGWTEVGLFSILSGLVDNIYLVACEVVSFTGAGDGNLFCGAIAKASGAMVYASNDTQTTGAWPRLPYGTIDGFEGKVWRWLPNGSNELTDL